MSLNFLLDPTGTIAQRIKQWDSSPCSTEKECLYSLFDFLICELPGQKIQKEYGHSFLRIDIVINDQYAIEIKKNLTKPSDLQRLLGQIYLYRKSWSDLFVVMCGLTRPDYLHVLNKAASDFSDWLLYDNVQIIPKE